MVCESCGEKKKCNCNKDFPKAVVEINNPEQLVLLRKVVIPASMGTEEQVPASIGKYYNVILQYEANGHIYLYSSDGIPTEIEANVPQEVLDKIAELNTDLANETRDRELADNGLQTQIDAIVASSDVKDIVGTYAELEAYDTSTLGNNDIIKVLADETRDDATTYYRWSTTSQSFSYIGEEGPYYTKSQTDVLLGDKQDTLTAGANITISNNEISATDTTYSDFTGATASTAGSAGLVPAPLAGDETKFLSGNGQWTTVSQYALPIASDTTLGGVKVGDNLAINPSTGILTAPVFQGATNVNQGYAGVVPAPYPEDQFRFLMGNGRWATPTNTTYTAGTGLNLNGTEFSVDTSTIQPKLTAGSNITIDANNEISAIDTTYSAGNAIDITSNVISADVYPADYFTSGEAVTGSGSQLTMNGTIEAKLNNVELLGDTAQQTYTGKNLLSTSFGTVGHVDYGDNGIVLSKPSHRTIQLTFPTLLASGTYTLSFDVIEKTATLDVSGSFNAADNTNLGSFSITSTGKFTETVTTTQDIHHIYIFINNSENDGVSITLDKMQLEAGSTATAFEPYVGGIASPNPDYPQAVNVVTGTQTLTITNGTDVQTYPITLGSVELCKIGDYQDKIYKSGADWYVHKEISDVTFTGDVTESWDLYIDGQVFRTRILDMKGEDNQQVIAPLYCYYYTPDTYSRLTSSSATKPDYGIAGRATVTSGIAIRNKDCADVSSFKTWLSTHNTTVYYALATPTDTQITDASLVAQLNALYNATSYEDQTNFEVTATSPNLPAILGVSTYKKSLEGTLGAIASKPNQDTTYDNFVGTDGVNAGESGLVPAPATTDAGKFLKADGTWDTAGGGGDTVYSTVTTSNSSDGGAVYIGDKNANQVIQTDPTTTDNNYRYFWALPFYAGGDATQIIPGNESVNIGGTQGIFSGDVAGTHNITIGYRSKSGSWEDNNTVVGWQASAESSYSVAVGAQSNAWANTGTAIGYDAQCYNQSSVALGKGAVTSRQGEVYVGCDNTTAFNNTNYRVIGGVYDGQNLHDAATVAQGNTLSTSAPTTSTEGVLGQLYTNTTTGDIYHCTAIDTTDPNNPVYTWSTIGGGGGQYVLPIATANDLGGIKVGSNLSINPSTGVLSASDALIIREWS